MLTGYLTVFRLLVKRTPTRARGAIEIGYDDKYNSQEILTEKSIESKLRELTGAKNP